MSQLPALPYVRQGLTPFFRLPQIDPQAAAPYANLDAVVLGVPWDASTTYRPGARFAPYEIRRVSALVQSFHPAHKIDVFETLRVADGGNVAMPPFAPEVARDVIENEIAAIVAAGALPFAVGGDHSIALPALRAVAKEHGPLCVVHVDAHLDTSDASVWGDAFHHGTPLRHAIEEGLVERGQLHQVGIRATWGYPEEGALAAGHGATLYDIQSIASRGIPAVASHIVSCAGGRPVYVTFDVDAIDPAFAPGTGTPVPGGLTSREAIALLRGLAGVHLVGMDLVEVCPGLDHADITAHLGAHLVYEGLALAALHARQTKPARPTQSTR
jgi:agmatinase